MKVLSQLVPDPIALDVPLDQEGFSALHLAVLHGQRKVVNFKKESK